jgi:hypothetical protein
VKTDDAEVAIAFENIGAAKLVLTDELIAATSTRAAQSNA